MYGVDKSFGKSVVDSGSQAARASTAGNRAIHLKQAIASPHVDIHLAGLADLEPDVEYAVC